MKVRIVLYLFMLGAIAGCASTTNFATSSSSATVKEEYTLSSLNTWGGPIIFGLGSFKIGDAQGLNKAFTVNSGPAVMQVWYFGNREPRNPCGCTFTQTQLVDLPVTLAPGGRYELKAWAGMGAKTVTFSLVDFKTGAVVASAANVSLERGSAPLLRANGVSPKEENAFAAANDCCRSIKEFHFVPLPAEGTIEARIGSGSPLFTFATGRSYFLAYALPTAKGSISIAIKSRFQDTDSDRATAYAFFPRLMLLDQSFSETRLIGPPVVHLVGIKNHYLMGNLHVQAHIAVGPQDPARYLVILTTSADMGLHGVVTVEGPIPRAYGYYYGPTGSLTISTSVSEGSHSGSR
jgi:hypothetical protein